jgi:hypothetical protein
VQLGELFDSLLDISRLDVSGIQPEIQDFPLGPLLERLAASFRRGAADRSQALLLRPTTARVHSDPQMLERMVGNLISNALRYTPAGGRILIAVRRRAGRFAIEVRDSGPGIAEEHQQAIFAEFYQIGNRAREQGQGLGLGLAIIDRLARALGIEVGLKSRRGHGTTFSLLVQPAAASALADTGCCDPEILFVGAGEELDSASELAQSWNLPVRRASAPSADMAALARCAIVVTEAVLAEEIRRACPPIVPVIVLAGPDEAPAGPNLHVLALPLRPAKLRALLGQLQKDLPKSIP